MSLLTLFGMRHRYAISAAAAAIVLVGTLAVPITTAAPAEATTYPSWSDVKKAKGNEQAKQAEVNTVKAALKSAQNEAAAKSQAALTAQSKADQAEADLADATRTASALEQQARTASATATRAKARAGQLAANLYRDSSSSTITTRVAAAANPSELLYQLGALNQLSSTWAGVMSEASVAANTASSLHDQASRAESERAKLASAAEARSAAAKSAQEAAEAAVSSTQQHSKELYAQLASLKDTTADTERQYQIGLAVAAQAAAQERARQKAAAAAAAASAAAAAAAANTTTTSSAAASSTSYPSTSGVTVDPTAAKAYASSAIGYYGWGSDQYSCLVSLWTQESGWRANALNSSSGAYGIPQALPATKMATAGADWQTNANTQIDWGLAYIKSAYGTPCAAWNHEMSVTPHWY